MARPDQTLPADIRSLTALRFFAALMVVLFHFSDRAEPGSWLHNIVFRHGYLGVDLFFVLSGFILSHVYLRQMATGHFRYGQFLWNRLARLYPLHLVMLVLTALSGLVAAASGVVPVATYGPQIGLDPATGAGVIGHGLSQLMLLHAWGVDDRLYFNGPSWSISAEWFAYLLFPLFAAVALMVARRPALALGVGLTGLATAEFASQALFGNSLTERTYDVAILRVGPEFLLGCLAYAVLRHGEVPRPLIWPGLVGTLVAIGVALSGGLPLVAVPVLFVCLVVLVAEADRRHMLGAGGAPGSLVYLGEISYSTYMVHLLAGKIFFRAVGQLDGLDSHALPTPAILLGVVFVLAVSVFSYQLIELPARRALRRTFGRDSATRPAPAR